jgi:hypothetical protein
MIMIMDQMLVCPQNSGWISKLQNEVRLVPLQEETFSLSLSLSLSVSFSQNLILQEQPGI